MTALNAFYVREIVVYQYIDRTLKPAYFIRQKMPKNFIPFMGRAYKKNKTTMTKRDILGLKRP